MKSLSKRGRKAAKTVLRSDMEISFEAQENQYHPQKNPKGSFPLNIAENKLMWSDLKEKFRDISLYKEIPDWVMGYTSPLGSIEFRESISQFYEKYLLHISIDPQHLACSPGATGIVEMTSFLLADAGDVAAFPAPSYPVYRQDIGNIADVKRYDIITHKDLSELKDGPTLSIKHLTQAKRRIHRKGNRLKILVLTSPDNPTGLIYDNQSLYEIAMWCHVNKVHLILNEIYALSRINNSNHPHELSSYGQIMTELRSDYLHHWYSFSKDFGISGFRVGIVYSHNESFLKAYENLNLTHSVSNHTQWLIGEMVSDTAFLDQFIVKNQKLLTDSYTLAIKVLDQLNVPYVTPEGSLFIWLDLSKYLSKLSKKAEYKLWMDIYKKSGVLLTPGDGFGHKGFGYFRMVYPYIPKDHLKVGLKRLSKYLKERKA